MAAPRVYTEHPLAPGIPVALEASPSHHLVRVLRLKAGDEVVLFNGDGHDYTATLSHAGRNGAELLVLEKGAPEPTVRPAIELAVGVSKGERMDFVVQKSVELGVAAITPLFCTRSVVQLRGERLNKRVAHWRGIAVAACEQSGRRRLPRVDPPRDLAPWLRAPDREGGLRLLLDPRAERSLGGFPSPGERLTLLVGPEGGFTAAETEDAIARGFAGVRLGPRVLRTETAPLAAIAAIQALWGDFR